MPQGKVAEKAITEEEFEAICEGMRDGKSTTSVCKELKIARSTFYHWLDVHGDKEGRLDRYARAMAIRTDVLLDEITDIADEDGLDVGFTEDGKPFVNHEHINRSKVRIDTRFKFAERVAPKKYGLRNFTELTGRDGGPIATTNERHARILELLNRAGTAGAVESAGGGEALAGKSADN